MKYIHLWGVKQNNLKDLDIKIPIGKFIVVCGPSGSGKSSLAFETLFAEGQRRFIESMSNYTKQFLNKAPKPDIEGISNIPPSIAIEQKNSVKGARSTVGTTTELLDYFRLLFEKIGVSYCPNHEIPTKKYSVTDVCNYLTKQWNKKRIYILVEIQYEKLAFDKKKLPQQLIQDGFLRIAKLKDKKEIEILELSDAKVLKNLPKENFYLVIDRNVVQDSDIERIADSVDQAYETSVRYHKSISTRSCSIVTTERDFKHFSEELSCEKCDFTPPPLTTRFFSFNSPVGACPTCKGFGNILTLSQDKVIPNPKLTLLEGAISPLSMPSGKQDWLELIKFCKKYKISMQTPWNELSETHRNMIWKGHENYWGIEGLFKYLDSIKYKMHVRIFVARFRSPKICPDCQGSRLRSEALYVKVHNHNLKTFSELTLKNLDDEFNKIKFTDFENETIKEIKKQINSRLKYLNQVGVGYLTMSRETKTLSGGEYQRLNLANQLGVGLSQTLFVLDEPTVGLHPRDNDRLINILKSLKDIGNTLVVVEHDRDVITESDCIVEMGPGSGTFGGEVMYNGETKSFLSSDHLTAKYISSIQHKKINFRPVDLKTYKYKIKLTGATTNNLKKVDLEIPLHRLVTVTGVSGSGKSTLISKTLYPALAKELEIEFPECGDFQTLSGVENLKNVVLIDQSAVGRTTRSSAATYMKAFDGIRTLMAATQESKARGYSAGTFSLNVDGGRCPACKGTGIEEIDMVFMDNVILKCDICDGSKYLPEILEIKYKDKNISQILKMTVQEAMNFFVAYPSIRKPLSLLKEVGLDYIAIGQSASSLSGGESQRLKIAKELSEVNQKSTLYILDEPTTGLHFKEIETLMSVLNKLVDAGGSVLLVEHNLDVISQSDYIIDLGPDAGEEGGQIVAQGSPTDVSKIKNSLTGQYLAKIFQN